MLNIQEPVSPTQPFALFNLAFRPFFAAGVLFAVLSIIYWALLWTRQINWQPYAHPVWWHAHELIFGFAAAIIVGFLLTAVQTWTGVKGIRGWPLALLFAIWLIGRMALLFPVLPALAIATIDVLFLLVAAGFMAYPVFKVKQKRNIAFPFILLLFALLNALGHYALMLQSFGLAMSSLHAAVFVITLFITVIGGRVIPFFTANATDYARKNNLLFIEILAIGSVLLLILMSVWGLGNIPFILLFSVCALGFISHGVRLARWGGQYCLGTPLLWSLHLAYAFIPLGMLLLLLWSMGLIASLSIALHSFTVGAMAGMVLAMISRVSLGHTGRPLKPEKLMSFAFAAITLAALIRTIAAMLWPSLFNYFMLSTSALWIVAFGLFLWFYLPILFRPRVDGLPG